MRLLTIEIANFRSVRGPLVITVRSPQSVLVGPNNAGKSNILAALDWLLRRSAFRLRPHPDDYFDPARPIKLSATLGEITDDDKRNLYALCQNNQQRGALGSKTNPEIAISLTVGPAETTSADGAAGEDNLAEDTDDVELGQTKLGLTLWGFPVHRKVAETRAKLAHLLLVSPVRRIDDELSASRWTPYGELMKGILEASEQFPELERQLAAVTSTMNTAFGAQKAQLLEDARVVTYVEDLAFQLTKNNSPVELLRNLQIVVTESGRVVALERLGTGTQSVVIIGMLELVLRAGHGDAKIFVIEEPDAFIHPHGVRHLATLIRRIAHERASQVVLSTHSPSLLATLRPGEIIRVEKREGSTEVFQAEGLLSDTTFARYINQDTAEIFFARRAVLVEGATERFLLPPISALVERAGRKLDFAESCVSVVDIGGKSGIVTYLKLLHEFEIEAFAILDDDFLGDSNCVATVKYLRSRGVSIDDSSNDALRRDLATANIIVLSKGEIEDYIPEGDIVAASERSEAEVRDALARHAKTSDAFKAVFGMGKPQYAQTLAELYCTRGNVPSELERLIAKIAVEV